MSKTAKNTPLNEDVFFDAVSATDEIFHEVEELPPVSLSDFKIELGDWRVHILKQIKANRSQDYNKFGRSLYEEGLGQEVQINVFVEEGDEIRMYSSGHLIFELLKRGKTPAEDRSYTFGFGPEPDEKPEEPEHPEEQNPKTQLTATVGTMSALFSFFNGNKGTLGASGVGTAVTAATIFLRSSTGCFFSPDPGLETYVKDFLTGDPTNFVLGTCRIGKDPQSQELASAMNRLFDYVNRNNLKAIKGHFRNKSPYINMIVPQKWSTIPMKCRRTENCASFFQTMIGDHLIHCAVNKFSVTHPNNCKFVNQASCEDCETRDFSYISGDKFGDKFGGKKSKKRRRTLTKRRGSRRL